MAKVKVGLVQMTCVKDVAQNMERAIKGIRDAAKDGAQIICLQELFTSLYFCDVEDHENFKLAESIPGTSTEILSPIAKELGVVIIASLFEKRTEGLYHNTTAVIDADGAYLGKYRKIIEQTKGSIEGLFLLKIVFYRPCKVMTIKLIIKSKFLVAYEGVMFYSL